MSLLIALRGGLLAVVANWPCPWAVAHAFKVGYYEAPTAPGVPAFSYSNYHIPWIAYLSPVLSRGLTPPEGIGSERTPDGGLLLIATQEPLDPANPDQMTRSRAIAELMIDCAGDTD